MKIKLWRWAFVMPIVSAFESYDVGYINGDVCETYLTVIEAVGGDRMVIAGATTSPLFYFTHSGVDNLAGIVECMPNPVPFVLYEKDKSSA
jgi:hypothetical protein